MYNILFRAAADTLLQIAADPKHLGAKVGCLAMLHTWGQQLQCHPHIHMIVPGGGLSDEGEEWIDARSTFFVCYWELPSRRKSPERRRRRRGKREFSA